jgi:SAM-dependent methyltransferase
MSPHATLARQQLVRKLGATGELVLPSAPSMLDAYTEKLSTIFAALGRTFNAEEIDQLRKLLGAKLAEAFRASPHSSVVVRYSTAPFPSLRVTYAIGTLIRSMEAEYQAWIATRQPPLFGTHPDAKLMELARTLPAGTRCLDVGSGTGRNALALARAGLAVDALEVTGALAAVLSREARKAKLPVRVLETDVLSPEPPLEDGAYGLIVASEVLPHLRDLEELGTLTRILERALAPGGRLLVNSFMPRAGVTLDEATREACQVSWSTVFTREELDGAAQGLALESDEEVLPYERSHAAPDTWPPTSWYEPWAGGRDAFPVEDEDEPPIHLRWLVYVKPVRTTTNG